MLQINTIVLIMSETNTQILLELYFIEELYAILLLTGICVRLRPRHSIQIC